MPGPLTTADLIGDVRDLIQHKGANVYRDGYLPSSLTPDVDTDGTPILKWINRSFSDLLPTGYCKCWFKFTTLATKSEYTLDEGAHEIQHALIGGLPLVATTFLTQDQVHPGWQYGPGVKLGRPTAYYTYSDQIGLVPYPDAAYDVFYLADSFPGDLVNAADIPTRLSVRFHPLLAVRAAWYLSNQDVENEVAAKRIPALEAQWKAGFADLQAVVQSRQADLDEQVLAGNYRKAFGFGMY